MVLKEAIRDDLDYFVVEIKRMAGEYFYSFHLVNDYQVFLVICCPLDEHLYGASRPEYERNAINKREREIKIGGGEHSRKIFKVLSE